MHGACVCLVLRLGVFAVRKATILRLLMNNSKKVKIIMKILTILH